MNMNDHLIYYVRWLISLTSMDQFQFSNACDNILKKCEILLVRWKYFLPEYFIQKNAYSLSTNI